MDTSSVVVLLPAARMDLHGSILRDRSANLLGWGLLMNFLHGEPRPLP